MTRRRKYKVTQSVYPARSTKLYTLLLELDINLRGFTAGCTARDRERAVPVIRVACRVYGHAWRVRSGQCARSRSPPRCENLTKALHVRRLYMNRMNRVE